MPPVLILSKSRGRKRALALAIVVVSMGIATSIWAPSGSARPFVTGVADPASTGMGDPVVFSRIRETGARFVQLTASWQGIAPDVLPAGWDPTDPADPNYDWTALDSGVIQAVNAGLAPLVQLYGAPDWAQRCTSTNLTYSAPCNPDPQAFANFAKAAARRYNGSFQGLPRVRFWEAQNEPNLSLFFNPQFERGKPVSPALYRLLINAFYTAVKSVDRSNVVIAAGLGPVGIPGFTVAPLRFARLLLCMRGRRDPRPTPGGCGGGVHFDVFDMHPYTTGGPTHVPRGVDDVALGNLSELRELLAAADRAGRIHGSFRRTPLWVTEFGWDSKPPDPGGLPIPILTRWASEAFYRAWEAGVSHFFWFELRDWPLKHTYAQSVQSGLYFSGPTLAEDRPKKVLYAFRFPFVAFPEDRGFFFWGRTPTSTGGRVVIQVRDLNGWRTVAVARTDRSGIFTGEVETSYGRNKRGFVRARYRRETAIPFSLKPVKDFYQPPFG